MTKIKLTDIGSFRVKLLDRPKVIDMLVYKNYYETNQLFYTKLPDQDVFVPLVHKKGNPLAFVQIDGKELSSNDIEYIENMETTQKSLNLI